jgi:hypothetical protein
MSIESVVFHWQEGERRMREAPPDQRRVFERVTERLVDELRRRLGSTFTADELAELYEQGTEWCLDVASRVAPQSPAAWQAGVVADAAFARYLRESADYAGGRLVDR